jgi:hypothetical protein
MNRIIRACIFGAPLSLFLSINAFSQTVVPIAPPGPNSPKTVTIRFVRTEDSVVKLDRLDGFNVVLEKDGAKYTSKPIAVLDTEGFCTIANVPPGEYKLSVQRLGLKASITIPAQDAKSVSLDFTFTRSAVQITVRPASARL